MLLEDTQLARGRYRLLRALGGGSMGEVYLAEDRHMRRRVAIKVVATEAAPYADAVAAAQARKYFEREMRAIAQLDHPHILDLYDYGEEQSQGLLLIYVVMPYRPEGSLADRLRRRLPTAPLTPEEVADLIRQAAAALQHAHDHQIIHQNVKPSNFLLQLQPQQPRRLHLLLSDFGVARFVGASATTGQIVRGSPSYMAPEQWEGRPTYASDQYALAIMAYELLVGHPPFQGAPGPMMYQHLQKPPPPPSSQNPALPAAIDAVLLRALAKQPRERFPSVAAFAEALARAVTGQEAEAAPASLEEAAGNESGLIEVRLAISHSEALSGTSRTLTVAGEELEVCIDPGVVNGQTLYVPDWHAPAPGEQPLPGLLLKLDVVPDEVFAEGASEREGEETALRFIPLSQLPFGSLPMPAEGSAPPLTEEGSVQVDFAGGAQVTPAPTPSPWSGVQPPAAAQPTPPWSAQQPPAQVQTPPPLPRQRDRQVWPQVLLVLSLLLFLLIGGGLLYYLPELGRALPEGGRAADLSRTATEAVRAAQATARAEEAAGATAQARATEEARDQNAVATATAQAHAQQATATAQAQSAATATAQAMLPALGVDKTLLQARSGNSSGDCAYTLPTIDNSGYPGWSCTLTLSNAGHQNLAWSSSVIGPAASGAGAAPRAAPVLPAALRERGDSYVLPASGVIRPAGTQQVRLIVRDFSQGTACPATGYVVRFSGPVNSVEVAWTCA
jgi:serine/threonine protein kinase